MKILITGGTGYLGCQLAVYLMGASSKLAILSRRNKGESRQRVNSANSTTALFDTESDVHKFLKEFSPDVVIHTAGAYGRSGETIKDVFDANMQYGITLLQGLLALNKKITFLNSGTSLPLDLSPYALSKNQFAKWGQLYTEQHPDNFQFFNLQLQRFYGPGDFGNKFTAKIINACINNEELFDLTPGEQQVDFIYIDDVISAYGLVLAKKNDLPRYLDIPVGTGETISIKKFAEMVRELSNSSIKLNFGGHSYRKNEPMNSVADLSVLSSLGWRNSVDLKLGLTYSLKKGMKP